MTNSAPPAPLPVWSDRQRCAALAEARAGLMRQLALHKPRSPRHAVLTVRLMDVTASLLEAEARLAAIERHIEAIWSDDDDSRDGKSRAAGQ